MAVVPGVLLKAVCDPRFRDADSAWLPCPVANFAEVCRSSTIDAVLIAAPTHLHHSLVEAALRSGKHVLCEKPLTLDPEADSDLARLAREVERCLHVGFWRRFAEPYRLLRGLLGAARLGRPRAVRAAQWDAAPPPADFCDPTVSGGLEIDCGVHEFDLALWMLGKRVEAIAAHSPVSLAELAAVGDVDTVHGLARLEGDLVLAIDLTRTAGYRDTVRTEVLCERGSAVVAFDQTGSLTVRWANQHEVVQFEASDVMAEAVASQLAAFAAAVSHGASVPDAAGPEDSRVALLAALAFRRARLTGAWCCPGS